MLSIKEGRAKSKLQTKEWKQTWWGVTRALQSCGASWDRCSYNIDLAFFSLDAHFVDGKSRASQQHFSKSTQCHPGMGTQPSRAGLKIASLGLLLYVEQVSASEKVTIDCLLVLLWRNTEWAVTSRPGRTCTQCLWGLTDHPAFALITTSNAGQMDDPCPKSQ